MRGSRIYPHRPDLSHLYFHACFSCKAWVGCFGTSQKPMGRIANAHSRKLKSAAHAAFDPIWKSGHMTRTEAYAWLQAVTKLSADDCHMGKMPDRMLEGVAHVCKIYTQRKGITND